MRISSIDVRMIYYMRKTSDYYHIKFNRLEYQGEEMHPAGEIITRAVTQLDQEQYVRDYGCDADAALYSATITRYGTMFWDEGKYTPPNLNANTSGQ